MAKKIILFILIIGCLSINANAYILQTYYNPSNYLVGYMDETYGGESDDPDAPVQEGYTYYLAAYYNDNTNRVSPGIPTGINYVPVIMMWNSFFNPGTIYKFSVDIEFEGLTEELETGIVSGGRLSIMPADLFTGIIPENVGVTQVVTAPSLAEYELAEPYPSLKKYYHMFYDATQKKLSCIFMLPETWSGSNFNNYIVCDLGSTFGSATMSSTVQLVEYTGLTIKDNYTEILEQIRDKLDGLAGGGGLTEEQINQAIQDALTAHDQMLEQEVDSKLDQIMEQITGIVSPYSEAADQINTAFDGLSDVFASTSTASVFKFPAGRMPNGVVLWQEHNIDIGAAWLRVPAKFRAVVQIVCTFTILYAVIQEAIFVIRFIILGRKGAEDD